MPPPSRCECREGFEGETCEVNVDDCASSPCLNGGSCRDEVGTFVCSCPSGWTGERCEEDVGYCDSDPCENDAECVDLFQVCLIENSCFISFFGKIQ